MPASHTLDVLRLFTNYTSSVMIIDPTASTDDEPTALEGLRRLGVGCSPRAFCRAVTEDCALISGALPSEVWG